MDQKPAKEAGEGSMKVFQRAIHAGYSCIPCDGKRPAISAWKKYMTELPDIETAGKWGGNIGIVCGKISGGVTCIDFDTKNGNCWEQWVSDVNHITPLTLSKLYIEQTPSGGYHVVYRSGYPCNNKKLACNKDGLAMIETRGEGGYFVCAPSEKYNVYFGQLSTLKPLDDGEPQTLLAICESYNEIETLKYVPSKKTNKQPQGKTVFDRYDCTCDVLALLESHGWTVVSVHNEKALLRRPGKKNGVSASWNHVPNRFYVFSTSTIFKSEHVYKPSAVYTMLEHGGDFTAACKQLAMIEKNRKRMPVLESSSPDRNIAIVEQFTEDAKKNKKTVGVRLYRASISGGSLRMGI